jgi:hypothetical protein
MAGGELRPHPPFPQLFVFQLFNDDDPTLFFLTERLYELGRVDRREGSTL